MRKTLFLTIIGLLLATASCEKPTGCGKMSVNIGYSINGKPLVTDSLCYRNEAGNLYLVNEIQWFLSKMELQDERGEWFPLGTFYIDTNLPESQILEVASIPAGNYQTLRFTFGLDQEDNQTGWFADPPEAEMFWPDVLGGGYHYMKLNGKYVNAEGNLTPLAIHLGIGQNNDHTEFYQNWFTVTLPIVFRVAEDTHNRLELTMVVDNWFRHPNTIDFNTYGSHIMQNQEAQQALKENGGDVFRIGQSDPNENDTIMEKSDKLAEKFNSAMRKAAPKPHFWNWKSVKERLSANSSHRKEQGKQKSEE